MNRLVSKHIDVRCESEMSLRDPGPEPDYGTYRCTLSIGHTGAHTATDVYGQSMTWTDGQTRFVENTTNK